jgi:hypothetical protein
LPRLLNEVIAMWHDPGFQLDFRHIYWSILPFLPPSSLVLAYYKECSDPTKKHKVHDVPNPQSHGARIPIACAALSDDDLRVALNFCDGVVEVFNVEHGIKISLFADGPSNLPLGLVVLRRS